MVYYVDTSVLGSFFFEEAFTSKARDLLRSIKRPLCISPLTELEFENALALRLYRKELQEREANRVITVFHEGLKRREKYVLVSMKELLVWQKAKEVSSLYTKLFGTRSLDVWHIAFALVMEATDFLTFDQRQGVLAKELGLRVSGIE